MNGSKDTARWGNIFDVENFQMHSDIWLTNKDIDQTYNSSNTVERTQIKKEPLYFEIRYNPTKMMETAMRPTL